MPGTRGPVPVPLQHNERDLTQELLNLLDTKSPLDTNHDFPHIDQPVMKAALDRLSSRSMLEYDTLDNETIHLTPEAALIRDEGSHEYKVWHAVRQRDRLPLADLKSIVGADSAKVGQGNAFKLKWIKKDGDALVAIETDAKDSTRDTLTRMDGASIVDFQAELPDYRKRKLVVTKKHIHYTVRKGPKFATDMPVEHTDLTAEMLEDGSWATANFKPYNFNAMGAAQSGGSLHPINKVRTEIRNIFFNMGFIEMPTGRYVDSGFWNFDALFVPQQHPARDLQDTFYVSDPAQADMPRADPIADQALDAMEAVSNNQRSTNPAKLDYDQYYANVRTVHTTGDFGSIGYRYPFNDAETRRLVLRTHTTAVSTYCLHRLAANPRPCRYFSIDRVFRNETTDATHLAEFHQVEGVIADYGLTLGGLMSFLRTFFAKLGITDLRFKPAYNPYTEPSMEVFGYHSLLKKSVEIGNSGLFRPEMLRAMGLPANLLVYGFGLSLERPTMIKYGISNIRELVGHKVNLDMVESNAAVRLDKD